MALQTKSGLGLLCWCSIAIMFYSVRLLASRPTPVNFGGPMIFCWGFTHLAKGSSFKALKTRLSSHFHLLHNPLCFAPGPPRGGWEFGFVGTTCRLNTHEAFWYLTGHDHWQQHAPPEPYQPSVQIPQIYTIQNKINSCNLVCFLLINCHYIHYGFLHRPSSASLLITDPYFFTNWVHAKAPRSDSKRSGRLATKLYSTSNQRHISNDLLFIWPFSCFCL
jgi:hypothetical protein